MLFRVFAGLGFVALAFSFQTQASACNMTKAEAEVSFAQSRLDTEKMKAKSCKSNPNAYSDCSTVTKKIIGKSPAEKELEKAQKALDKESKKCKKEKDKCYKNVAKYERKRDKSKDKLKKLEDKKAECDKEIKLGTKQSSSCKNFLKNSPDIKITDAQFQVTKDQLNVDDEDRKCVALP